MTEKWLKNNILSLVLIIVATSTIISACTKAPINGKLDGMWEVTEISINEVSEIPPQRLFYNFSLHVCMLTYFGGTFTDGNMRYSGNELMIEFPYADNPSGIEKLQEFGIFSNPVVFEVEFPSKNKLILRNGDTTISLRRF